MKAVELTNEEVFFLNEILSDSADLDTLRDYFNEDGEVYGFENFNAVANLHSSLVQKLK